MEVYWWPYLMLTAERFYVLPVFLTLTEREDIMLKKSSLLLFFIVFWGHLAFAQTGSIKGVVTNEQGEPVPTANVLLVEVSRGAATNLQGEYAIPNVQPGTYTLRISYIGY